MEITSPIAEPIDPTGEAVPADVADPLKVQGGGGTGRGLPLPSVPPVVEPAPQPTGVSTPVSPVAPSQEEPDTFLGQAAQDQDESINPVKEFRTLGEAASATTKQVADWWSANMNRRSEQDRLEDLSYTGPSQFTEEPTQEHIDKLRKLRNNPEAIAEFNSIYGENAASRYIRYAGEEHIAKLLKHRDDPDAVRAFNALYGEGMAQRYALVYDDRTDPDVRARAAREIRDAIQGNLSVEARNEATFAGEMAGSVERGVSEATQELVNSAASISNYLFGTQFKRQEFAGQDTRIVEWKVTNTAVKGITQFLTGTAIGQAVLPGIGALSAFKQGMVTSAFSDAFAFKPDDPTILGQGLKSLSKLKVDETWWKKMFGVTADAVPEGFKDFFDTSQGSNEASKRAVRALEGSIIGLALKALGHGIMRESAWQRGDKAAAKKLDAQAKAFLEQAQKRLEQQAERMKAAEAQPQGVRPQGAQPQGAQPSVIPERPTTTQQGVPYADKFKRTEPTPADVMNRTRQDNIRAAIEGEDVFKVKQGAKAAEPEPVPLTIRPDAPNIEKLSDLISRVTRPAGNTFEEWEKALAPHMDEFMNIPFTPKELSETIWTKYSAPDAEKVSAIVNAANKRLVAQARELQALIKSKEAAGRANEAQLIREKELTKVLDQKALYDVADEPWGTFAGNLLNRRRMEISMINQPAARLRIDKLRELGYTTDEIMAMIEDALNRSNPRYRKLELAQKSINFATDKVEQAVRLGDKIGEKLARDMLRNSTREYDKLTKQIIKEATQKFDTRMHKIVQTMVEVKLNALLYSGKTLMINFLGNTANLAIRAAGEFIGTAATKGFREAYMTTSAGVSALKSGHSSYAGALKEFFKMGREAWRQERSVLTGTGLTGENLPKAIAAETYGLDPTSLLGKTVDQTGKIVRVPGRLMAFSDDFLGAVVARREIGAEAATKFMEQVSARRRQIAAQLRDPTTTPAQAKKLRDEAFELKANPTLTRAGKQMKIKDYVDEQINKAFNPDGSLKDPQVIKQTEKVLFKNPFEGKYSQALETALTSPLARLTYVPFYRTPIRAMQASFEFLPILNQLISPEFKKALRGDLGAREMAIARGKSAIGYGLTIWMLDKVFSGEVTGAGPTNYKEKRAWEAGGWVANHIKIGDKWFDYSSAEPFATVLKVLTNTKHNMDLYGLRKDKVGAEAEFITALGASVVQSIADSSMLAGVGKGIQHLKILMEGGQSPERVDTLISKVAGDFVTSFIPSTIKQVNNMLDPRLVDRMTILDSINASLYNKSAVPFLYDALGNIRTDANPAGKLGGLLVPLPRRQASNEERVLIALRNISMITGKDFAHPTKIKEAGDIDLREVRTVKGDQTLMDRMMEHYRTITIGGRGIADILWDELKNNRHQIGNYVVDGKLTQGITKIMADFRKEAWERTKREEIQNLQLQKALTTYRGLQWEANDPDSQKSIPGTLRVSPKYN